jgi:thiol-disulfide isomerase/thioredoxin
MVLTPSTMLPLGTRAPEFSLRDVQTGKTVKLADFAQKKALVVMFICEHCPYVKHIADGLSSFARDYAARDVALVAISANDAKAHPDDAPEKLAAGARARGEAHREGAEGEPRLQHQVARGQRAGVLRRALVS